MEIEKFETIRIWIRKVCGSKITEKNYLRRLEKFFEHYNVTPNELVKEWKEVRYNWTLREKFVDEWSEKIERYYALLDYAPLAKISEVTPVKSFFRHCRIPIEVQLQKHAHVLYHNRNLSKEEIRRILDHSGLREKTFFPPIEIFYTYEQPKDKHVVEHFREIVLQQIKEWRQELERKKAPVLIDFSFLKTFIEKGGIVLTALKCPNCSAPIKIPKNGTETVCDHCGGTILAQDVFEKIKTLMG